MDVTITQHARARLQQRGIPEDTLSSLLSWGRETYDHHGSAIYYFDHRSRDQLRRALGPSGYRQIEPHLDAYAVVAGDGAVVTVGHRTRRINRH